MNLTVFQNSQSERFFEKVETFFEKVETFFEKVETFFEKVETFFEKVETISGPSGFDFFRTSKWGYYPKNLIISLLFSLDYYSTIHKQLISPFNLDPSAIKYHRRMTFQIEKKNENLVKFFMEN